MLLAGSLVEDSASKLLVRLPLSLHRSLKATAAVRGVTLNEFCIQSLQQGLDSTGVQLPAAFPDIEVLVNSPLVNHLEGIVMFGSQARGDARDSSDTDLLLCLERGTDMSRADYRRWDEVMERSGGAIAESVSPHFAVLPESAEVAGSLWFEVAADGIVLWDRQMVVSRFLGAVRRCLLKGHIARKTTYGVADCFRRASVRLRILDLLFEAESWPDVVRESQEAVELALKGLLRSAGIESPRVHDVSQTLLDNRDRLPQALLPKLERIASHSRQLRRDRELAFYGSEDLTPGEFYRREDASAAREMAREVIETAGIAFPR